MSQISLWQQLPQKDKEKYITYLQIFGALSGLFKDIENGSNADKPYLYYRNHEQLFARVFNVEDLTRHDSAFDAIANIGSIRIGIGLKTWSHERDKTFQKVAEFNKLSATLIRPLIEKGDPLAVVHQIAQLRNDRILLDQRTYKTTHTIYHNITRDDHCMNIVESSYELIDLDSIKVTNVSKNNAVFDFQDRHKRYKFYVSKSVLLQEFDASDDKITDKINIKQNPDPFELLAHIDLASKEMIKAKNNILYLPIYADKSYKVEEKSGFNASLAAPKSKNSKTPRPDYEAYIPIPVWIHHIFPQFFGFDALDPEIRKEAAKKGLTLHLPSGEKITAIITQDQGKSLQTNPQNILGKWILRDVFDLAPKEMLTMEKLQRLGVDSLKIQRIDSCNFKIDLADTNAFEAWKVSLKAKIESCPEIKTKPKFRFDLEDE